MSDEIKDTLSRIEMHIEEISSKFDILISLLRLSHKQSIQQIKRNLSNMEQDVYSLCDGSRTVSEIARTLGKSIQQISIYLGKLDDQGLVTFKRKGKHKYYESVI